MKRNRHTDVTVGASNQLNKVLHSRGNVCGWWIASVPRRHVSPPASGPPFQGRREVLRERRSHLGTQSPLCLLCSTTLRCAASTARLALGRAPWLTRPGLMVRSGSGDLFWEHEGWLQDGLEREHHGRPSMIQITLLER